MQIRLKLGRFHGREWLEFYRQIVTSIRESLEETHSEQRDNRTAHSIENHIKPYVRENGDDCRSLGRQHRETLVPFIKRELREKEIASIKAELEALDKLTRARQRRLQELNASDLPSSLLERLRHIEEAKTA